jgi:predicted O-methyltransferase YrrM
MVSRILFTGAELRIFDLMAQGPLSLEEICKKGNFKPRPIRILLDALASQGFLHKSSVDSYSLDQDLISLLTTDGKESILPMVLHGATLWKSWTNLTDIVKAGENTYRVPIGRRSQDEMESFIGAMHVIGQKMAEHIAGSLDLSRFNRLLDVGGASGTYAMAFLRKFPGLTATIFDLEKVSDMAKTRILNEGFSDRIAVVTGDYSVDELPQGYDLVLLSAVIHSNSREANRQLYVKVFKALEPGGAILIRDYIMDSFRTSPPKGAVFAVNMLAATTDGDTYTFDEMREDLQHAGFSDVRMVLEGENMDQVLQALKSS